MYVFIASRLSLIYKKFVYLGGRTCVINLFNSIQLCTTLTYEGSHIDENN